MRNSDGDKFIFIIPARFKVTKACLNFDEHRRLVLVVVLWAVEIEFDRNRLAVYIRYRIAICFGVF